MTFPTHVVFYSAAAEGAPSVQLSMMGFIVFAVIPMAVLGVVLWWARDPKRR